jgi:hypothetical protein
MKQKPVNPYTRLANEICKWMDSAFDARHTRTMWVFPKSKLSDGWSLVETWERTAAAAQLGYEVHLEATDEGLHVIYKKKLARYYL